MQTLGPKVIGLKRHTDSLVPHNPEWLILGSTLCTELKQIIKHNCVEVKHVGSTSVPGLHAKPIIDIAIGYRVESDVDFIVHNLPKNKYIYRGLGKGSNGHLFVVESKPNIRIGHVHCIVHESNHWNDYILFQKALLEEPKLLKEYQALKIQLAEENAQNRKKYTSSKNEFITGVIKQQQA